MRPRCDRCDHRCIGQYEASGEYCRRIRAGDAELLAASEAWEGPAPGVVVRYTPGDSAPAPPASPPLLSAEDYALLSAAENCPHLKDCECRGKRCGPGGTRPGQLVTIRDCLECVRLNPIADPAAAMSATPIEASSVARNQLIRASIPVDLAI